MVRAHAPVAPTRRRSIAVAGVVLAGGAAAGWAGQQASRDRSLSDLHAAGAIRIGYAVEPPYAFVDIGGRVGGESPELARAVAGRLGLRTTWILTGFERLLVELELGRFDLIASGLFVNAERATRVRFSRPTLRVRPGWLVPAGNPLRLAGYADAVRRPSLRLAVVSGSLEAQRLQSAGGGTTDGSKGVAPTARVLPVPDAQSGLVAVVGGMADGLALSLPSVTHLAARGGSRVSAVAVEVGPDDIDHVALAVRRGARALATAVDAELATLVGSPLHRFILQDAGLSPAELPRPDDAAR